jgi:GNAT superfamily N-acetyltransferase
VVKENIEYQIEIVCARACDTEDASSVMVDAALRLIDRGQRLWIPEDLAPEQIQPFIEAGQLYLIKKAGSTIGTMIFQLSDDVYWPDMTAEDSAYIHKLVLTQDVSGYGIGRKVIAWARDKALLCGRKYLRLDCEAHRVRLCAYYESVGFSLHSYRQVGRQFLARYEMKIEKSGARR